jgi:hypothetical protein
VGLKGLFSTSRAGFTFLKTLKTPAVCNVFSKTGALHSTAGQGGARVFFTKNFYQAKTLGDNRYFIDCFFMSLKQEGYKCRGCPNG